ncbi:MAG: glycosyltransferase [Hydrogenophilales bacterium 17-64-65]|nr:MAG: glycosyltransferase [Hydrogenophilales bacterium 16-64-40]OZA31877.1 MAG: glycosyltransferase [Hydrogenophilales bacterium 17-64-65]
MKHYPKLIIQASNVHQGGGRSLLEALLKAVDRETTLLVDERMLMPDELAKSIQIKLVKPSVVQRLLAEKWLVDTVEKEDVVLCFGNLPPLFKLRGHTMVFLQNRYLIEDIPLNGFPLKIRLRLEVERLWLSKRLMNVDEFVVQTPTMKRLLESKVQGKVPVRVLPFVAEPCGYERNQPLKEHKDTDYDFVYVASGEPHKNHQRLLEAWSLLASEGLFPSLCLTLDKARFEGLCSLIVDMRQRYGMKVSNVGVLPHHDVLELCGKSGAVIYPSKFESFGLPLIEARQAGLSVLASELDFVRDVLDPEQSFDPDSPLSIARAVKRFMGVDEQPLPLLDAAQFVASVFKRDSQ